MTSSCNKTLTQNVAASPVLRLVRFSISPPNVMMAIKATSIWHVSRGYGFCPRVHLQTAICFLCHFRSNGFFLSQRPFSPCWCRTLFTVDNQTVTSVSSIFTRSFAFVLLFSCFPHVHLWDTSPSSSWSAWRLDIPMFLIACNSLIR